MERGGNAANYPLSIERGATFLLALTYSDAAGPVNLTGCTARMHIRSIAFGTLALDLTTENGRITLGGAAGTINLEIAAAITAVLPLIDAHYDLAINFPGGKVIRLLSGDVQILAQVTQ